MRIRRVWLTSLMLPLLVSQLWSNSQPPQEIPIQIYRGHWIMVEGSLFERSESLRIVIDTGANATFVNTKTAKRLGLHLVGASLKSNSYGKSQRVQRSILRGLRIGPRMVTIACFVAELPWSKMDVILGMDVLKQKSFTIDYQRKTIQFGDQGPLNSKVPFEMVNSTLLVPVRIGKQEVRLALDTGAEELTLFQDAVKTWIKRLRGGRRLAVIHAAGSSLATQARLPSVQLGPDRWNRLQVLVLDAKGQGRRADGVLSLVAMGMKRARFDFEEKLFSWEM